jgi:integrase
MTRKLSKAERRLLTIGKVAARAERPGRPAEGQAAEAALTRMSATPSDIETAEWVGRGQVARERKAELLRQMAEARARQRVSKTRAATMAAPEPTATEGAAKAKARRKLTASEIRKRQREGRYHDGRLPLSAKRVAKLKGEGRYHDALVKGLYLQITASGARSWLLRYETDGREHMMGLGPADIVSLAAARERARAARLQLHDGVDPLEAKRAAKAAKALNFRQAAERYFDQHQAKWTNAIHRDQFLSSLKAYAFPHIGDMDVADIGLTDVLRCIEPQWTTKAVTMDRTRNRIEAVLDWATVRKHRSGDNPARWAGFLDQVLPAARQVAPVAHYAALDYRELPKFMADLRQHDGTAARALEFTVLTAARSGEVFGARWDEISFDEATWTVPASRMKTKTEHRVPLSPPVLDLLRALPRPDGNPFVFVGQQPGMGLSGMTFTRLLHRMGRSETVHGFRSTFSDWANEQTGHSSHTVEISLAHKVGSEVERAYRRKDMLAKRVKLMNDWVRYCYSPPVRASATVVPMREREGQR